MSDGTAMQWLNEPPQWAQTDQQITLTLAFQTAMAIELLLGSMERRVGPQFGMVEPGCLP